MLKVKYKHHELTKTGNISEYRSLGTVKSCFISKVTSNNKTNLAEAKNLLPMSRK